MTLQNKTLYIIIKNLFMKIILCITLILIFTNLSYAKRKRITVNYYEHFSKNPTYLFGLKELIAKNLSESSELSVVSRSNFINHILYKNAKNIDPDGINVYEICTDLSVDYLIEISSDKNTYYIQILNIKTKKIDYSFKINLTPMFFEANAAIVAKNILTALKLTTPKIIENKILEKQSYSPISVYSFSSALTDYDFNMRKSALKKLEIAKKNTSNSKIFNTYMYEIATASKQLLIWPENYAPIKNPAYLGADLFPQLYLMLSLYEAPVDNSDYVDLDDDLGYKENDKQFRLAYNIPYFFLYNLLSIPLGIGFEVSLNWDSQSEIYSPLSYNYQNLNYSTFTRKYNTYGFTTKIGLPVNRYLFLGGSLNIYKLKEKNIADNTEIENISKTQYSASLGLLIKAFNNKFSYNSFITFTNQEEYYLDLEKNNLSYDNYPLLFQETMTIAIPSLQINLLAYNNTKFFNNDRTGFISETYPVIEFWATPFLSITGGYINSYINFENETFSKHGYTAGIKFTAFDLYFDINYTRKFKSLQSIPGYGFKENSIFIAITNIDDNYTVIGR